VSMKKITGGILFFLILTQAVCVQGMDKPVARIKLIKTEVIYQTSFKTVIQSMEKKMNRDLSTDERKVILDKLIEEKLLVQAAKKENIIITQSAVDAKVKQVKQLLELQEGRRYTDKEFQDRVTREGGTTWEEFLEQIKNSVLQEEYIKAKKGSELSNTKKPSEEEIVSYYEENRTIFVSPEMIKFKQIFILTKGLPKDKKEIYYQRAGEIYKNLIEGKSFDEYSEVYIKGSTNKIGTMVIETWQRDDESRKVTYGKDFFSVVFKMKEGELSDVIESNIGYHIIMVLKKYPFSILALDDKIPPQYTTTVKEKIMTALRQKKELEAYQNAYKELIEDIKGKAEIKIYEENITW
jgi:parvulin-like peptidyl-prolyl isomerase